VIRRVSEETGPAGDISACKAATESLGYQLDLKKNVEILLVTVFANNFLAFLEVRCLLGM
jgi:hypothetical protein